MWCACVQHEARAHQERFVEVRGRHLADHRLPLHNKSRAMSLQRRGRLRKNANVLACAAISTNHTVRVASHKHAGGPEDKSEPILTGLTERADNTDE